MCACLELGETALPGKKGVLAVLFSLALCVHTQARTYPQSTAQFFFFPFFFFYLNLHKRRCSSVLCFDSDLRCANTVTHCTAHSTVCVFVRALLCPVCCLLIEGCCFYPVVFVLRYCAMRWRSQTPPPSFRHAVASSGFLKNLFLSCLVLDVRSAAAAASGERLCYLTTWLTRTMMALITTLPARQRSSDWTPCVCSAGTPWSGG